MYDRKMAVLVALISLAIVSPWIPAWLLYEPPEPPEPPQKHYVCYHPELHPKTALSVKMATFRSVWERGLAVQVSSHKDEHKIEAAEGAVWLDHRVAIPAMEGGDYLILNYPGFPKVVSNLSDAACDSAGHLFFSGTYFTIDVGLWATGIRGLLFQKRLVLGLPDGSYPKDYVTLSGVNDPETAAKMDERAFSMMGADKPMYSLRKIIWLARVVARINDAGKFEVVEVQDKRGMRFRSGGSARQKGDALMYSMADVVYGIPITRKMDRWLQKHMDDEDVQCEEFEVLGFEVQYSGNADHQCGFLGTCLTGMDVINPVQFLTDDAGALVGIRVAKDALANSFIESSLIPTDEQKAEAQAAFDKLPEGLKPICPPIGIYIVWSTS